MPDLPFNKYRAAIEILQRGRDQLVENMTNEVLEQSETLLEGGFQFNEFLESQGTKLHFLGLLVSQLEYSAEILDEARSRRSQSVPSDDVAEPPPPPRRRARPRSPRPLAGPRRRPPREKSADDVTS